MNEEQTYLSIPGYIPVKVAAMVLGLSEERVLQYLREQRLPSRKVAGRYLIPLTALATFRRKPHGRVRSAPVLWRTYRAGAHMYMLRIIVPIFPGQEARFLEQAQRMLQEQEQLFPGTRDRYVCQADVAARTIEMYLFWKDTELHEEAALQQDLLAFQRAFDTCLDWAHASTIRHTVLAHT